MASGLSLNDLRSRSHALIAPSAKDRESSGMIRAASKKAVSPRPLHLLHAPKGLLKENRRGSTSSMLNPETGQANFAEKTVRPSGAWSLMPPFFFGLGGGGASAGHCDVQPPAARLPCADARAGRSAESSTYFGRGD